MSITAGPIASGSNVTSLEITIPTHEAGDGLWLIAAFTSDISPAAAMDTTTYFESPVQLEVGDDSAIRAAIFLVRVGDSTGIPTSVTVNAVGDAAQDFIGQCFVMKGRNTLSSPATINWGQQESGVDIISPSAASLGNGNDHVFWMVFDDDISTEADVDTDAGFKGTLSGFAKLSGTASSNGLTFATSIVESAQGDPGNCTWSTNADSDAGMAAYVAMGAAAITVSQVDDKSSNVSVDTRQNVTIAGGPFGALDASLAEVLVSDNATYASGTNIEVKRESWSDQAIVVDMEEIITGNPLSDDFALPADLFIKVQSEGGRKIALGESFYLGAVGGATWRAALNTDEIISVTLGDVTLRLRMGLLNTGGDLVPQVFKCKISKNSGAYNDLTTSSSDVKIVLTDNYANGDDTITLFGSVNYQIDNNAAIESDGGDFDSIVLLYNMDGADTATDIIDASNSAHVETFIGTAQLDTAQKKFGSASLLLDGDSDYITIPDSTDWILAPTATDPFTVECHIRLDNLPTDFQRMLILSQNDNDEQQSWTLHVHNIGSATVGIAWLNLDDPEGEGEEHEIAPNSTSISVDTWHHVAVCSDGITLRIFVDGVEEDSSTAVIATANSTDLLYIGALNDAGSPVEFFDGWIDNVRITKGLARYTTNFTPPTEAFVETSSSFTITASDWSINMELEAEYCIKLVAADLVDGDTLDFRMYENDNTVFPTYTETPRITIVKAGANVLYNPNRMTPFLVR